MKKRVFSLIILLTLLAACHKNDDHTPGEPKIINLPVKGKVVVQTGNGFGINLFRETAVSTNSNLMLSPLSASAALSMLMNGCEGETYNQIRDMLGYENLSADEINATYMQLAQQLPTVDPEVKLSLANALFYRTGFSIKTSFTDRLKESYLAQTAALNFNSPSSVETINQWASDNTNGKITRVISEISPDAVIFLMNALYFNGQWTTRFDKTATTLGVFTKSDGNLISVTMMKGKVQLRQFVTPQYHAIELPYGRQNFAMDIIIPTEPLNNFTPILTPDLWQEMTEGINIQSLQSMDVEMPKFKFDYEKILNQTLGSLGMTDAFMAERADLSGISDEQIFVSFVKQNTFIDVNEAGTEAAAVTTIGMEVTSMPESLCIDKPFVFAIRELTTNALLFIGKVEEPAY